MFKSPSCHKLLTVTKYFQKLRKMSSLNKCKVAVCQFTACNDKSKNLVTVKRLIDEAVTKNAKVIFLPEACDFIAHNKDESRNLAESLDGELVDEYKKIANKNKIWLSIGGFHEKINNNTMYNTHILIDDTGNILSLYRKTHLFDVSIPEKNILLQESDYCTAGSAIIPPVETPAGLIALSICYDLRFPEISTLQTKFGANILTYPSAFTATTGPAHWEILLRARAVENQCYVIAAAQYGQHNSKRTSYGHSMIVDPWGVVVAECPKYNENNPTNESIAVAEVNTEYVKKIRQEMPVQKHRRTDIYNLNLLPNNNKNDETSSYTFADKIIPASTVFYKSNYCYAFTNIRCVVPGHVLVATLRCAPRLLDLTQEEIADLFQTVIKVQRAMEVEHDAGSTTICVQDGKFAGQTVPHVHVHILPRKLNDFKQNDDIYWELAKHDSEENVQSIRSIEEMSEEARKLRTHFGM
ncbi:nitrilase and fragile histidine triad fusion protein NitFhit [Diabrotica undecimpunctata]|uniref:nitrilase and fragile histidine triad fusion protein NitFhit n=1 Tax=Diabrotica undecimpunctata TaxID=50387 RepID=UPI003B632266